MKLNSIMFFAIFLVACGDENQSNNKPVVDPVAQEKASVEAAKYRELVNLYVGKKVPYEKFPEIGSPETLTGTTNQQWVAYFPEGNFTIVTNKKTDIVRTVYIGKREF